MRSRAGEAWAVLGGTYWFVPSLLTVAALGLCAALVYLDHTAPLQPSGAIAFFFPTSLEGARALLSAVVSSMMTVAAVTFSVTIVALTVASQHYGPRLLNSFMQDRTVQIVLGTLIGTFAYSVVVLGSVRGDRGEPLHWATMGTVILVAGSVGALILYVHHASTLLQASSVVLQISRQLQEGVQLQFPERQADRSGPAAVPVSQVRGAARVASTGSGYIQRVDEPGIAQLAQAHGAVVRVLRGPGKFVERGVAIATVHPAGVGDATFARKLNALFVLGRDRTSRHDVEFAAKQLVEIALRGLSPGMNEPFTAILCIDRLGEGLSAVASRGRQATTVASAEGEARLVMPRETFETLLRASFDPVRIFAGPNPAIYARLLDAIARIAEVADRDDDRQALRHQADLILSASSRELSEDDDREFVQGRFDAAIAVLEEGQPVL